MKATIEGRIQNAEINRDNIVLEVDLSGKDQANAPCTGHVRLVVKNTNANAKMQLGRVLHITISDEEGAT